MGLGEEKNNFNSQNKISWRNIPEHYFLCFSDCFFSPHNVSFLIKHQEYPHEGNKIILVAKDLGAIQIIVLMIY